MQQGSCRDCGVPATKGVPIDGTSDVLCGDCLLKAISVASRWDYARRTHRAAHGHDGPGCHVCGDLGQQQLDDYLAAARTYA